MNRDRLQVYSPRMSSASASPGYPLPRTPARASRRLYARLALASALAAHAALAPAPLGAQYVEPSRGSARPAAQLTPRATGVIDGLVTDTALRPVPFAEVVVVRTDIKLQTNSLGKFRFIDVPAGDYLLIVRRLGYRPVSSIIRVGERDTLRLAFELEKAIQSLDAVTVVEERRSMRMLEFEQRRKQGWGYFITGEQIEKRNLPVAADYLRLAPSVQLAPTPDPTGIPRLIALSKREGGSILGEASGACAMQVVLDGVPMTRAFPLELLPTPKDIAGIEVYDGAATVPLQFSGPDRRCGMILIWTKDY